MAPEELHPHRRIEDYFVTYKEMVEYFARQSAEFHQIRAEGFVQVSNQMEKIEDFLTNSNNDLKDQFLEHEKWHRDVLQGFIERSTQNKISVVALCVSSLGIIISTVVAIIAILHR